MRSYGKIESAFWQNPKVHKLSDPGKLLLLYIYSTPHGNSVGCFVLPDGYIMADIGWSLEQVSKQVSELVSNGFIERQDTLLRIVGWFDHNTIENDNVAKAAVKALRMLPSCPIKTNLISDICSCSLKHLQPYMEEFSNGYRNGFRNPEPDPEPNPNRSSTSIADARATEIFLQLETFFNNPRPYIMAPVYAWLSWGADFEKDIEPAAKRFMKRGKGPPGSLEWLDDDIAASIKKRGKPMPDLPAGKPRSTADLKAQDYTKGTEGFGVIGGGANGG